MSEEPQTVSLGRKTRLWAAGIVGAVFIVLIFWTTIKGTDGNSLHESAQAWAFVGLFGILLGLGISGKMMDLLAHLTRK